MTIVTNEADEREGMGRACGKTGRGEDDFLSLRDLFLMILRHRWKIAVFVLVVTLLAGVYFVFGPRQYQAEGYLQVIPPVSIEGKVDQDLFDTIIVSHLQRIQSAFIAEHVASILAGEGYSIDALALKKKVNISRPPRANVIRVEISGPSQEIALMTVRTWIEYYLKIILENNMTIALSQVRAASKDAQVKMIEKQACVDRLKLRVTQSRLLTPPSRAVDDQQVWKELADNVDPASLKKTSEIYIKGGEQGLGYVILEEALLAADEALASAVAGRNFFNDVERALEAEAGNKSMDKPAPDESSESSENARLYAEMLLKSTDIFQFGEPAPMSTAKGVLFKIGLVFVCSMAFACFCAFFVEWLGTAES